MMCRVCRHQTTVTAGTLFDKTRTPLRNWFSAAWHMTSQKNGISALGLQKELGLKSYQTAWGILHRLRRAMVMPEREQLSGIVEIDETFVGGPARGTRRGGLSLDSLKSIVIIAVEIIEPKGFGRIRMKCIPDTSKKSLLPFVQQVVKAGSTIRTDGLMAYRTIPGLGYLHEYTTVSYAEEPAHITMPAAHRVASLLKRWLLGTHQGSARLKHLDRYLDEFVFRFNRRAANSRGLLFYRLLEQAVETKPVTYQEIIK